MFNNEKFYSYTFVYLKVVFAYQTGNLYRNNNEPLLALYWQNIEFTYMSSSDYHGSVLVHSSSLSLTHYVKYLIILNYKICARPGPSFTGCSMTENLRTIFLFILKLFLRIKSEIFILTTMSLYSPSIGKILSLQGSLSLTTWLSIGLFVISGNYPLIHHVKYLIILNCI